jgi:hypothetical protein
MKLFKLTFTLLIVASLFAIPQKSVAQCAMCTMNAENSVKNGNKQGTTLNNGILYLLAAPYLAIAGVGFLWYKKYRRKAGINQLNDETMNLN